jgi:hypothetical protein
MIAQMVYISKHFKSSDTQGKWQNTKLLPEELHPNIRGQKGRAIFDPAFPIYLLIEPNTSYPSPKGIALGRLPPLPQKANPGCRFYEKFYRNRFRSVSNESSRREMSALSSDVLDLPPSVIPK